MKFKSIVIFILMSSWFFLSGQNSVNKSYILKLKSIKSENTLNYLSSLKIQTANTFKSCLNYCDEIKKENILSSESNLKIEELKKYFGEK